jgi:undecaprenyl-phosphate galactose phosphotransferase
MDNIELASAAPTIGVVRRPKSPFRRRFLDDCSKRALDVIGGLVILFVLSPILLLLAILVAADGGPVFFGHRRAGRDGESFYCWKFRTMVVDAEECLTQYLRDHPESAKEWQRAQKLALDPRVTRLGAFLRASNLDEIPQMWNVIVGQMSLVGPRPVTETEMRDRYGHYAEVVTSVRPGVTGIWQITPNRNQVDYSKRVQLDALYVRERSLATDIGILLQTARLVLGSIWLRQGG